MEMPINSKEDVSVEIITTAGTAAATPATPATAATATTTTTTTTAEADFDLDENLSHLGIKGFFPSGLYVLLCFLLLLTPMQYFSSHVNSLTPEHRCRLPPLPNASTAAADSSSRHSVEDAIPKRVVDGIEKFASCERFEILQGFPENGGKSDGKSRQRMASQER